MDVLTTRTAPRYTRPEGITSYLLASTRTCGAEHLTTSLVDVDPGGAQRVHSHAPEQIYFILEGRGRMTVGTVSRHVQAGDCVFIPSRTRHGLENTSSDRLRYFSAAAPAFLPQELESFWPLSAAKPREEPGEE